MRLDLPAVAQPTRTGLDDDAVARANLNRSLCTASLRLDASFLDDRPPLLDLGLLLRGESLRRLLLARPGSLAHVGHPLAHQRIGQCLHHRGVELADDILGCTL